MRTHLQSQLLHCIVVGFHVNSATGSGHLSEQEVTSLGFPCFLFPSPDVTMAARFRLSSDSDSEPSEEVEEGGESGSFATERERQALPRHALTLSELRIPGEKLFSSPKQRRRRLCPFFVFSTEPDVQAGQPPVTPEDICEGLHEKKTSIMWLNEFTALPPHPWVHHPSPMTKITLSRFRSHQSDQGQLGIPSVHRLQRGGAPGVRGRRGRDPHRRSSVQGKVQIGAPRLVGCQEIRPTAPKNERRVRQLAG